MSAIGEAIPQAEASEQRLRSFVLLPLGNRRFALPAESVVELVAPSRLAAFPHRTPWISGVIIRRGRVVPVCDTTALFGDIFGPDTKRESAGAVQGRFLLIAEWRLSDLRDWCAIPVSGECELASPDAAIQQSAPESAAHCEYITGVLHSNGERIEILDLGKLIQKQMTLPSAKADKNAAHQTPLCADVLGGEPAS